MIFQNLKSRIKVIFIFASAMVSALCLVMYYLFDVQQEFNSEGRSFDPSDGVVYRDSSFVWAIFAILFLLPVFVFAFSKNRDGLKKGKSGPFELSMQYYPGKGDASYSDAISRVDIELFNHSKKSQLVRRQASMTTDAVFDLNTMVTIFDSLGSPVAGIDHRANEDRGLPKPSDDDYQVIQPGKSIFLTTIVVRKPKGSTIYTIAAGSQVFENLNAGSYSMEFKWSMGIYDSTFALSLARKLKVTRPWVGEINSDKFSFEIKD